MVPKYKYYCGLDIHKDTYTGYIMDNAGNKLRSHRFPSTKEALTSFMEGIPNCDCVITIENCALWRHAKTILTNAGFSIILVPAYSAKIETGVKKTDYYDAKALAELTRIGHIKSLYIPPDKILDYRDIVHQLLRLRKTRVQYMNRIKSELLRLGINYSKKIWDKKGIAWLLALKNINITSLVNLLLAIIKEEKYLEKKVKNIANSLDITQRLQEIPGIGEFLSLLIYSEIGEISRFDHPKKLVMYCGLCPGIHQSGDKSHPLKNKYYNRSLKWALYLGSGKASILNGTKIREKYQKLLPLKGMQKARRCIARDLAIVIWHMITENTSYNPKSFQKCLS